MKAIEWYAQAAERLTSTTLISGRYKFQAENERHIPADLIYKLDLNGTGTLLEIGCGVGTLLTHLAQHVTEAFGIDHPSVIAKFSELGIPPNVSLLGGEWPLVKPKLPVDRVLCYSVLSLLPDAQVASHFVRECIDALRPGGILLLGDLANVDKRRRFIESDWGKPFQAEWEARLAEFNSSSDEEDATWHQLLAQQTCQRQAFITDAYILQLLTDARHEGHEAYVLPQPANLPFSFTREDLVIRKAHRRASQSAAA